MIIIKLLSQAGDRMFQNLQIFLMIVYKLIISSSAIDYKMRILVQRVFQSWVKVGGAEISRIKEGLLVLVGITHDDTPDVADHMVSKILNMRLWEREGKSWNGTVMEIGGEVMVVSQFTLYGILKGNKPDFHASMEADKARELFDYIVEELKTKYSSEKIQTGKFQALMEVGSVINGPVTIHYQKSAIDMPKKKAKPLPGKAKQKQEQLKQNQQIQQVQTKQEEKKIQTAIKQKIEQVSKDN